MNDVLQAFAVVAKELSKGHAMARKQLFGLFAA